MTNYLLAGGGTAGHVNPLLALAEEIKTQEPDATVVALGTAEGLESRLVPERGFELEIIPRTPFPRRPNRAALGFPAKYLRARRRTAAIIRERNIDVVVGFGGYVSTPAYAAAKKLGVPYVIHEGNALPGLANKLGARGTRYVATTFPGTPLPHSTVTGMPLRREITTLDREANRAAAATEFGLEPDRPTLLVTGGSLGARALNEGISASAAEIIASGAQVLHIWGGLTEVQDPGVSGYRVLQYCDRMDLAFSLADLAVSRSGATTVCEVSGLGIPAIFSPYRVGNGEQALNSQAVVAAGGALQIEDGDISGEWIRTTLLPLLYDRAALALMSEAAQQVAKLDGAAALLRVVQQAVRGE